MTHPHSFFGEGKRSLSVLFDVFTNYFVSKFARFILYLFTWWLSLATVQVADRILYKLVERHYPHTLGLL